MPSARAVRRPISSPVPRASQLVERHVRHAAYVLEAMLLQESTHAAAEELNLQAESLLLPTADAQYGALPA
jgi:hypothetical protein